MRITYEHHFDASIDDVVAMFSDEEFTAKRAHADDRDVLVDMEDDGSFIVVIRRTIPAAAIPSEFRAFVGSELRVRYTGVWAAPDSSRNDGVRDGTFAMEIPGTPGHARGTVTLTPADTGTTFVIAGDVRVSVPLVGPMVERALASAIEDTLPQVLEEADNWLATT